MPTQPAHCLGPAVRDLTPLPNFYHYSQGQCRGPDLRCTGTHDPPAQVQGPLQTSGTSRKRKTQNWNQVGIILPGSPKKMVFPPPWKSGVPSRCVAHPEVLHLQGRCSVVLQTHRKLTPFKLSTRKILVI